MIRQLTCTLRLDDGELRAYVARPDRSDAPAVVVLHEVFGVNATMRACCDVLAAHGYLAVCPDLFWRIEPGLALDHRVPDDLRRAGELYAAFDVALGVRDIVASIDAIRRETLGGAGVGVLGYCLGGLLAYLTATQSAVDAAVAYYGVGIENHLGAAAELRSPLMLHIAEEDRFVPKSAQARIEAALAPDARVVIHRYAGREHAFARLGGAHFHGDDAALAEARTLTFLAALLRKP